MTRSNPNLSTDHLSPALLALKRFAKSTLRQVGIGLTALMIVLNLGVHAPGAASPQAAPHSPTHSPTHSYTGHPQTVQTTEARRGPATHRQSTHKKVHPPALLLGASMTHHHLTSARLSIPTTPEQTIASASDTSASEIEAR